MKGNRCHRIVPLFFCEIGARERGGSVSLIGRRYGGMAFYEDEAAEENSLPLMGCEQSAQRYTPVWENKYFLLGLSGDGKIFL